jgi:hypothetical protein
MQMANEMLSRIPLAEKELMDKTRFQNIKEALYLTLLQKREEALIAKASITVNSKVIYPPLKNKATIKPSKLTILFSFILVGLLIPILFAIIKEITNKKIISKKQLQNLTTIPVIAELELVQYDESSPFVIGGNNRSMFGEQIRTLRTNMDFYLINEKSTNYILLTSNANQTFIGTNAWDNNAPFTSRVIDNGVNTVIAAAFLGNYIIPKGNVVIGASVGGNEQLTVQSASAYAAILAQSGGITSGSTIVDFRNGANVSGFLLTGDNKIKLTGYATGGANKTLQVDSNGNIVAV